MLVREAESLTALGTSYHSPGLLASRAVRERLRWTFAGDSQAHKKAQESYYLVYVMLLIAPSGLLVTRRQRRHSRPLGLQLSTMRRYHFL